MHPRFVFDALPIRVKPQPQETLTSLLMRNAAANRLTSLIGLYATLTLSPQYRNPRSKNYLIDHPPPSWGNLATILACSREDLRASTFHHLVVRFGREPTWQPMGIFLSGSLALALRFCPQCLAEQQEPYYRLSWRFSFLSGCATHGCRLWDICPQCVTPVKGHHLSGEQSPTSSGNGSMPNVSLATERKVKDQSMTRRRGRAMVPANRSVSQGNLDMVKAKLL